MSPQSLSHMPSLNSRFTILSTQTPELAQQKTSWPAMLTLLRNKLKNPRRISIHIWNSPEIFLFIFPSVVEETSLDYVEHSQEGSITHRQ